MFPRSCALLLVVVILLLLLQSTLASRPIPQAPPTESSQMTMASSALVFKKHLFALTFLDSGYMIFINFKVETALFIGLGRVSQNGALCKYLY